MTLAERVEGRSIHATLIIKMTPQSSGECGETDSAEAIGHGLLNEVMTLFKRSAEAEGFLVTVSGMVRVI